MRVETERMYLYPLSDEEMRVVIVMFVSVLNRSYECEYCYYSTNSEV